MADAEVRKGRFVGRFLSNDLSHSQPWVRCNGIVLLNIVHGARLNDFVINMAQQLLKAVSNCGWTSIDTASIEKGLSSFEGQK